MRSQFLGDCTAISLMLLISGCAMPQHSNTMFFGTNTNFGITAGQDVSGVPAVNIGYRRQEAVVMPLVANIKYDSSGVPTPCVVYPQAPLGSGEVPPCFLVGKNDGALDTYSVLASFGAEFSASATNPEASGGLAQFFATGLAAQVLAAKGGSSLVAVSEAAAETGKEDANPAIAAIFDAPEVITGTNLILADTTANQTAIGRYLEDHTSETSFATELIALETSAGRAGIFSGGGCSSLGKDACLRFIRGPVGAGLIGQHGQEFSKAVDQEKQRRGLP